MSETTALPPVTERGFTNLMITGFVYPMTVLPVHRCLAFTAPGKRPTAFLKGRLLAVMTSSAWG
ncbi:hypothetical protein J8C02_04815 [Chloracidobacterium sp. MS 40/45]|uniref:hypothetical protein n=1 Tax=Chloracidobacterium aggregatum TaxID=2851959 RepID=UPI001B8C2654|nr:hypothetical protein [Chloracidobacterium aggregatum]QUW00820.1 hypothetical protein J8C02_04815 [Chloracidobacterium sp. MS 40/45]